MTTFAARMLEAKHAKLAARNRGESIGNKCYRRALTRAEQAELDAVTAGTWWQLVQDTRKAWQTAKQDVIEQFRFAHHEIRGDSLYFTLWEADRV
jgi:hypothetical protein